MFAPANVMETQVVLLVNYFYSHPLLGKRCSTYSHSEINTINVILGFGILVVEEGGTGQVVNNV